MPYIKNTDRIVLEDNLKNLLTDVKQLNDNGALTAGTLNYIFTRVSLEYMKIKGVRYQNGNDVMGALEGTKLEFYRRILADYEDLTIAKNGDVDEFKEISLKIHQDSIDYLGEVGKVKANEPDITRVEIPRN